MAALVWTIIHRPKVLDNKTTGKGSNIPTCLNLKCNKILQILDASVLLAWGEFTNGYKKLINKIIYTYERLKYMLL